MSNRDTIINSLVIIGIALLTIAILRDTQTQAGAAAGNVIQDKARGGFDKESVQVFGDENVTPWGSRVLWNAEEAGGTYRCSEADAGLDYATASYVDSAGKKLFDYCVGDTLMEAVCGGPYRRGQHEPYDCTRENKVCRSAR